MRVFGAKAGRDDGAVTVDAEDSPSIAPDALDDASASDLPILPRGRRRGVSASSLLAGRGWVGTLIFCDLAMLALALAAALIGASAANIETDGAAVLWLFPPIV